MKEITELQASKIAYLIRGMDEDSWNIFVAKDKKTGRDRSFAGVMSEDGSFTPCVIIVDENDDAEFAKRYEFYDFSIIKERKWYHFFFPWLS